MMGFNNIIGHEEIIGHLKNAIESGKISHSYIFTGEPGSGKKLLAGTFAATLQCEAGGTEPCQKCDSCKKAMGKNHPDIIMVSHEKPGTITIDEIRDQVINDIDIRPYYSPYKIYIIADADLMTRKYYGEDAVCPVYVQVEDGERLSRALNREREQENPRYEEMCRRFIADQSDFSEENILNAGIEKRFQNINLDDCVKEIANYIKSVQ